MMRQLMCKEVLYEPLKELHEKVYTRSFIGQAWLTFRQFPSYLADHNDALTAEDKERYSGQIDRVSKIVEIFENPSYTDDNAELSARVVTLMNEVRRNTLLEIKWAASKLAVYFADAIIWVTSI